MSGQGVGEAGIGKCCACHQEAHEITQFYQAVSALGAEQIRALLAIMRASGFAGPEDAPHFAGVTDSGGAPERPVSGPASETAAADPCPRY